MSYSPSLSICTGQPSLDMASTSNTCGACWASTSGLEAAVAAVDACVCWEVVKWVAKAPIALLAAGLAMGLGWTLWECHWHWALGFFAFASVPPYVILGRGALLRVNSLFLL